MQTDARTEALLREKRQATSGASSSTDSGPGLPEGACFPYQNSLACPYCPQEPLDFQGLVQHLEVSHSSYPQRAAKCPICRRMARDMVPHLMQHIGVEEDEFECSLALEETSGSAEDHVSQVPYGEMQLSMEGAASATRDQVSSTPPDSLNPENTDLAPVSKPEPDDREPGRLEAEPAEPPVESSKAADPPPPQPGGFQDTVEMRAVFVQQMMLGVFGIGR